METRGDTIEVRIRKSNIDGKGNPALVPVLIDEACARAVVEAYQRIHEVADG
jgi:hypothetical protein